ncbi:MAG TPA: single-stranded DNA-binding protein [Candidatus Angelobacter sp.]|nr:single-stranded DNA-binding protein [Candidatus Angelobacter sp.]
MKIKKKAAEQKAQRKYVNEVRLVGYLGQQPKRYDNRVVMSLATVSYSKRHEDWHYHTEWHRIVAWGKLAEEVTALAKGDHIEVKGDLRSRVFAAIEILSPVTQKSSDNDMIWEIRARSVSVLDRAKDRIKAD